MIDLKTCSAAQLYTAQIQEPESQSVAELNLSVKILREQLHQKQLHLQGIEEAVELLCQRYRREG